MLNAQAQGRDPVITMLIKRGQRLTTKAFLGLENQDLVELKALKAGILHELTARGQGIGRFISEFLIVFLACHRRTEKANLTGFINHHVVLECMAFFLPL